MGTRAPKHDVGMRSDDAGVIWIWEIDCANNHCNYLSVIVIGRDRYKMETYDLNHKLRKPENQTDKKNFSLKRKIIQE